MPVILINPFSVPRGNEDEFLAMWKETAERVKSAPGFIETRMHRSLDPDAGFRFVNVARWESAEAWQAAFAGLKPRGIGAPVAAHPALYEVVAEH